MHTLNQSKVVTREDPRKVTFVRVTKCPDQRTTQQKHTHVFFASRDIYKRHFTRVFVCSSLCQFSACIKMWFLNLTLLI